jgi:hypothetical protein
MGSPTQGGQMRPQPQMQQQRPMGGQQSPQGKGPGLPMPQQPQMGGNRPYQPVGANNGPFNPNPVQPVNQPPQMPAQGKAPGQLPQGITPQMVDAVKQYQMQNPGAKGPAQALPGMQQQLPQQGPIGPNFGAMQ